MAFGFGDIGSMFSKGMGQYGQGLDKMRDLPLDQKLMASGQILHGGVSPADMLGAMSRLGQSPGAPGVPGAPGQPPTLQPPAATPPAQAAQNDPSGMFMGLLPLLMKNGMGSGLLSGLGGGGGGGSSGAGGLGGLLSGFGFGGH